MPDPLPVSSTPTPTRGEVPLDRHRARELHTIEAMVGIYCHDHHGREALSCEECGPLLDYATRRLLRCVFGAQKPTCANCTVHCYTETMRARIKDVMRYAGPRMLWRRPWLAIRHLLDGRRRARTLPLRKRRTARTMGSKDDFG